MMRSEGNYMDDVFREKLAHYEEEPPTYLFDEIEAQVVTGIRVRRRMFIMRTAAVIFLLIAFGVGYFTAEQPLQQDTYIVVRNNTLPLERDIKHHQLMKELELLELALRHPLPAEPVAKKNNKSQSALAEPVAKGNNSKGVKHAAMQYAASDDEQVVVEQINTEEVIAQVKTMSDQEYFNTPAPNLASSALNPHNYQEPQALAENSKSAPPDWKVGSSFSRYFALQTAQYQEQDQASFSNGGSDYPMSTVSGGVDFAVKPTEKLAVYSGVYFARRNGVVGEVTLKFGPPSSAGAVNQNTRISSTTLPEINIELENQTMDQLLELKERPENVPSYGSSNESQAYYKYGLNLDQQYDYVEIPAGISFKLIDRKMEVNAIAGVSASILVNQQARLYDEGQVYWKDHVDGLSKYLYHTRLGVNVDFPVYKSLSFYVQPTYRRNLNSIYKDIPQPAQPDRLAVFAGINLDL